MRIFEWFVPARDWHRDCWNDEMPFVRVVLPGVLLAVFVLTACGDDPDDYERKPTSSDAGPRADAKAKLPAAEDDDDDDDTDRDGGTTITDSGASDMKDTGAPGPNLGPIQSCQTSYYETGSQTANGEPFDPNGLTAAHKTFPFNTKLRVTNQKNGKFVDVRINDRGPFGSSARCLDLARGAFLKIESLSAGVAQVNYQVFQ